MFDEQMINAYRKATAPVELKERVMRNYQTGDAKSNNVRLYKTLQVVAACLILILSVPAAFSGQEDQVSVYMNGNPVTTQPMMISEDTDGVMEVSMERSIDTRSCIPLEIALSSESTIIVSEGEMQIYSKDGGELLFTGTEYSTKEDISVKWYIEKTIMEKEDENLPHMRVLQKGMEYVIRLEYNQTDGNWMIYEGKKN